MTDAADRARPRKATGPDRPSYFDTSDVDRVMAILLALVSEVASIRERLDTHERLAENGVLPAGAEVENYTPTQIAEADRDLWRDAYIKRLFRVIAEDVEALRGKPGDVADNRDQTS